MTCRDLLIAIDPYLDDELTVLESLRVQAHLRRCDACRCVVESEAFLHGLLAADAVQDEPPASLRERIREQVVVGAAARQGTRTPPKRVALLVTWLAGGTLAGLLLGLLSLPGTRGPADLSLGPAAVARHIQYAEGIAPDLELTAGDAFRLAEWVKDRLGFAVTFPAAAARGERLVGARVSVVAHRPAAHLVYEGDGRRISLFITRRPARVPTEGTEHVVEGVELYTATLGDVQLAWWDDRGRLYVAASRAEEAELVAFSAVCIRSGRAPTAGPPGPSVPGEREDPDAVRPL